MTLTTKQIRIRAVLGAFCITSALLLVSVSALAADTVVRNHQIDGSETRRLTVENAVGTIQIKAADDDQIRAEVELEGQRHGIFRRKKDVSEVDIEINQRGDQLTLALHEDDVQGNWTLYIPDFEAVSVQLGVGSLEVDEVSAGFSIEVGVGSVELSMPQQALGAFEGNVGVGGISQSGLQNYSSNRAVVTESAEGHGLGNYSVTIEVGVGDITLNAY
ncbi:hypothetical protein CWE12_03585 [Aliidiomarina sedimenti]|uniref:Adhesin domain-containing protein n=1 Tax=Aliidiomarina sedimenti TaxID=1933879 RepID=A0ABY0C342_9GAMM|nr:hypothetical protein [Aliidiomarina sedimenti]RUO32083.1 hypothetical protein CWE12_03585 [Aliidiomarina sedimenti]